MTGKMGGGDTEAVARCLQFALTAALRSMLFKIESGYELSLAQ